MAGIVVNQGLFLNFLRGFAGMSDIVINVTRQGYRASGTMERSYFVEKWFNYREGESCIEEGELAIGQLELFKQLVAGCGTGFMTINLQDDLLTVSGNDSSFSIPPIAEANSQQGVDVVANMVSNAVNEGWTHFGEARVQFRLSFTAEQFQQLRNAGKAIQTGSLYSVEITDSQLILTVVRDQIRVAMELDYNEFSTNESKELILWFGKWLMDALKAMPGKGTIHVYGGVDAPLILQHEAPDNEAWGTLCVIAPRQESGNNQ